MKDNLLILSNVINCYCNLIKSRIISFLKSFNFMRNLRSCSQFKMQNVYIFLINIHFAFHSLINKRYYNNNPFKYYYYYFYLRIIKILIIIILKLNFFGLKVVLNLFILWFKQLLIYYYVYLDHLMVFIIIILFNYLLLISIILNFHFLNQLKKHWNHLITNDFFK